MSDKLMINGRKYVSAAIAAEMTKYTQDYIGQLCRGNKVQATRIGRNWYVDIDSLLAHKEQNENGSVEIRVSTSGEVQRSNGSTDGRDELVEEKQEIPAESHIEPEEPEATEIPISRPPRIVGEHIATYSHDTEPLLPPLRKLGTGGPPPVRRRQAAQSNIAIQKPEQKAPKRVAIPKIHKEPQPPLFVRIGSALWSGRERIALTFVLVAMFGAMFTLHGGEIQYIRDTVVSLPETIENEATLTAGAAVIETLEETAMKINDLIDSTTYDFLYMP